MKKLFSLMLCLSFLLAGCGVSASGAQTAPEASPVPAAEAEAVPAEPAALATEADAAGAEAAADAAEAADTAADDAEASGTEAAALPDGLVLSPVGPGGITENGIAQEQGATAHIERTTREAYDPATGEERILSFSWDTVQVQSEQYPDAASKMTETLAAEEEAWYNGDGGEDGFWNGYSGTLSAAEDFYTAAQETGGSTMEFTSSRYVEALRADSEVCVFLVNYDYFGGGAHGTYSSEAICFDARTGERLTLAELGTDEAALKAQLVTEMLALAEADEDAYFSSHLDLTEAADYETAFAALLRDGSWYPGADGFHVFSDLYELGSYAAGITEFVIPYEKLAAVMDARWIPAAAELTAELEFVATDKVPEGSIETVDRVIIGEGGESWLLYCQGEAKNLSLWTGTFDETFLPECEVFFTGSLKDAALQVGLEIPGDLPVAMLRYTDSDGLHERLVSLSGENGDLLLSEESGEAEG